MKESTFIQPIQMESEQSYSPCCAIVILDALIQKLQELLRHYARQNHSKAHIIRDREKIISKLYVAKHAIIPMLYSDILSVLNTNIIELLNRDPEIGVIIVEMQVGKDKEKKAYINLTSPSYGK